MPKFIFAYHGGGKPETEEEGKAAMAAWQAWMTQHAEAFTDPGAPVGLSKTVSASGVADNGGANPLSGYTLVEAPDVDAACEIARGCPILDSPTGSVEVAPIMDM